MTGFTPEVGSSSRMMRGRPISTVANSSSLRWPNESVPAGASASRVRPKSSSTSSARAAVRRRHVRAKQRAPRLQDGGGHVLDHGQVQEYAGLLEGAAQPHPVERGGVGPPDRAAGKCDRAAVRGQVTGDQVEQGGLARAVGADQRGDGALRHRDRAGVARRGRRSAWSGPRLRAAPSRRHSGWCVAASTRRLRPAESNGFVAHHQVAHRQETWWSAWHRAA